VLNNITYILHVHARRLTKFVACLPYKTLESDIIVMLCVCLFLLQIFYRNGTIGSVS